MPFIITGGTPLRGTTSVSGRKNAALAVLPATILTRGATVLRNIPGIHDVDVMIEILKSVGASVKPLGSDGFEVNTRTISEVSVQPAFARRIRASYYFLGAFLARCGEADVGLPGGCNIGDRPIDQHLKGLRALGAAVNVHNGRVIARVPRSGLTGANISLDIPSVGATINIMLAACGAAGITTISNAAKEPHVVDVASYLINAGVSVIGAGTDAIKIRGMQTPSVLHDVEHSIISDDIEAATLIFATVATQGRVTIQNIVPSHIAPIISKVEELGAVVDRMDDVVRVKGPKRPRATDIRTGVFPAFPTDAQQLATPVLAVADGTSIVRDTLYEHRFTQVPELVRMGAKIQVGTGSAVISGVDRLRGASVEGNDLRAAASLMIAGLMADGETEISGAEQLDRGYDGLDVKLRRLGAHITRIEPGERIPGSSADNGAH